MNVQLFLLLFLQLFFVFGQSGTTPPPSTVDEDTKFVLDLVRGGVPVGIIQLFLPSDSEGAAGPCLRQNSDDDIDGMCKFVKAFAEDYAFNTTNDWSSCSKEDYVCNAIYRAATSNNTQNFSCSLWQQKLIQNRISEKMRLNDKGKLTNELKTSRRQGLFLGMVGTTECSKTCSDEWRPVCSVSALLLDFLPKVTPDCPETSNTENQTCQVFKNGTVSSLSAGHIDIKLPEKLVTKGVTVSVLQLPDGGKVKTVSTLMSIMEKMVNVSTSTVNVSMSGSVVVVKLPNGTNTTIFPNRNEVTIQKKGTFVSASINSSTIKVFTNKTNVTMSTKGLNLKVLTDTLPMAFSINKADVAIDKDSNWTCNISQANQREKATTQNSIAAPTANQSKKATTQKKPTSATPTNYGSTISISSYIIYIAIAGAILVIVGYIAYHNRDYLCKLIGNGGQRGRPKRKNYKHLKSLKDAFP